MKKNHFSILTNEQHFKSYNLLNKQKLCEDMYHSHELFYEPIDRRDIIFVDLISEHSLMHPQEFFTRGTNDCLLHKETFSIIRKNIQFPET